MLAVLMNVVLTIAVGAKLWFPFVQKMPPLLAITALARCVLLILNVQVFAVEAQQEPVRFISIQHKSKFFAQNLRANNVLLKNGAEKKISANVMWLKPDFLQQVNKNVLFAVTTFPPTAIVYRVLVNLPLLLKFPPLIPLIPIVPRPSILPPKFKMHPRQIV